MAVIYGGYNRLHLFALEQRAELIKAIQEAAASCVGIAIKQRKDPISLDQFQLHRLGKYRSVAIPQPRLLEMAKYALLLAQHGRGLDQPCRIPGTEALTPAPGTCEEDSVPDGDVPRGA